MARPTELPLIPATHAAVAPSTFGRRVAVGVGLIALIAASAQIAVPLPSTLVPVTLQELAVLVAGVVSGPIAGALTVAAYVLIGATGTPVFSAAHGGLPWLLGPTGGYLLAFPLAALVIGLATAPARPWWMVLPGLVAADLVIYVGGVTQLALVTGRALPDAVALGVTPFLPGMVFKGVLLVAFALALRRWRGAVQGGRASD